MRKLILLSLIGASWPALAIIGGKSSELFPEIVKLRSGDRVCTGTIVGPRVVLSAAHCATADAPYFIHRGERYEVKFVASSKAKEGHDLSLAIAARKIEGARIAKIAPPGPRHGMSMVIAGYGCTVKGGTPGKLHIGATRVVGLDKDHLLSVASGGGVLCDGDSGGPAFVTAPEGPRLVAVNSLSDIQRINVNVRIDSEASAAFFRRAALDQGVDICGVSGC